MLLPLLQNNLLAGGGSGVNVTPGVVNLTLTGYAPTVTAPAAVTPGAATLTLTGFAPTVGVSVNVTPGVGTLTLTGFAPSVTAPAAVTPGAASLVLTGFAPTVTAPASVTPAAGALTLTGFAPAVTVAGSNVSVTPDPATLTLTGYAPDVVGDAKGGASYDDDKPKRKKRYVIEVDGKLHVFTSAKAAKQALDATNQKPDDDVAEQVTTAPRPAPKPVESIALSDVQAVLDKARVDYLMTMRHLDALVAEYEARRDELLRDEQDIEDLLLLL